MDITRKKVERIIITGPLDECKKAQAHCRKNRFRIIQINPCLTDDEHRNKVTSFEIWAEQEAGGA